ncbi:hypothetical protein HDZ31DRAFT_61087 [Schizophyllum fasciatum]
MRVRVRSSAQCSQSVFACGGEPFRPLRPHRRMTGPQTAQSLPFGTGWEEDAP